MQLPKWIKKIIKSANHLAPQRKEPTWYQEVRWNHSPYFVRVIAELSFGKGSWNYLEVGVFKQDNEEEVLLGTYIRNYSVLKNTFFPFEKDGKTYALYSRDYTGTRIMSLPSCRDLGGEESDSFGFCPVDFYVPQPYEVLDGEEDERVDIEKWHEDENGNYVPDKRLVKRLGTFGFVAGCVWGDDSSWKIQYLDLREIENGVIKRDERFGYIEIPRGSKRLKDSIASVNIWSDDCMQIGITPVITYRTWTDGTIRVFGKKDIAQSTRNEFDRRVGEKIKFFLIDVGDNKYKGGYLTEEAVQLRLEYLEDHPDFEPQAIIELKAEATQEGYVVNGREIKGSIFFGIKQDGPYKGRTWMAEDDTYDLKDKDFWGL